MPTAVAQRRGLIKQLTSNQVGSVYSNESTGVRASGSVRRSFEQGKGWLSLAIISSADPLGVSAFTFLKLEDSFERTSSVWILLTSTNLHFAKLLRSGS